MLNKIIVCGRLVRDPENRKTASDVSMTTFTVAVERDFKQGDEKVSDFIDCVAFRYTADFISKNFTKGRMICVVGSLQSRKYDDKDGNKRTAWSIAVENAYFADSKPTTATTAPSGSAPAAPAGDFAPLEDTDASLPF